MDKRYTIRLRFKSLGRSSLPRSYQKQSSRLFRCYQNRVSWLCFVHAYQQSMEMLNILALGRPTKSRLPRFPHPRRHQRPRDQLRFANGRANTSRRRFYRKIVLLHCYRYAPRPWRKLLRCHFYNSLHRRHARSSVPPDVLRSIQRFFQGIYCLYSMFNYPLSSMPS